MNNFFSELVKKKFNLNDMDFESEWKKKRSKINSRVSQFTGTRKFKANIK